MTVTSRMMKPKAYIMVGPPCVGKTTWRRSYLKDSPAIVVSRDELRWFFYGKPYRYSKQREERVQSAVKLMVEEGIAIRSDIIMDETHCKVKSLQQSVNYFKDSGYFVVFVIMSVPFGKQRWRNLWRYLRTGFWIPRQVAKNMNSGEEAVRYHLFSKNSHKINYLTFYNGDLYSKQFVEDETIETTAAQG